MKLLLVAVGQRVPDWAQTAYDDYAKRFPPELKVELKAVKTEPRGSKTLETLYAAERERIEAAIPRGTRIVVLDAEGHVCADATTPTVRGAIGTEAVAAGKTMTDPEIVAIPLDVDERIEIGWIDHASIPLTEQAQRYLDEVRAVVAGFGVTLLG